MLKRLRMWYARRVLRRAEEENYLQKVRWTYEMLLKENHNNIETGIVSPETLLEEAKKKAAYYTCHTPI